jgi:hypothetical protein
MVATIVSPAHSYLAKNVAKLDDAEIAANRNGASGDSKADSAVRFATKIIAAHGHVSDADLKAVRQAGFDDAQIIEIVLHVALNTLTNYVNGVAAKAIDFPEAPIDGLPDRKNVRGKICNVRRYCRRRRRRGFSS